MKIKKSSKSSFFKKILLKLVRKLGYEMVDQSNLNIADEDLYINKNLSKSVLNQYQFLWVKQLYLEK